MYLEGIEHYVDVLGFAILELAQNLYLMDGDIDCFVLRAGVDFVICGVDIDDLEGDNPVVLLIKTVQGFSMYAEFGNDNEVRAAIIENIATCE